jgi:hypothetical protein
MSKTGDAEREFLAGMSKDAPERTWQEIQEWSKKFDGQLSTADVRRLFEIIAMLEQERKLCDSVDRQLDKALDELARLREAIEGMPCYCIRSGSADGTTTVMQKCRRCRALTKGENDG